MSDKSWKILFNPAMHTLSLNKKIHLFIKIAHSFSLQSVLNGATAITAITYLSTKIINMIGFAKVVQVNYKILLSI